MTLLDLGHLGEWVGWVLLGFLSLWAMWGVANLILDLREVQRARRQREIAIRDLREQTERQRWNAVLHTPRRSR